MKLEQRINKLNLVPLAAKLKQQFKFEDGKPEFLRNKFNNSGANSIIAVAFMLSVMMGSYLLSSGLQAIPSIANGVHYGVTSASALATGVVAGSALSLAWIAEFIFNLSTLLAYLVIPAAIVNAAKPYIELKVSERKYKHLPVLSTIVEETEELKEELGQESMQVNTITDNQTVQPIMEQKNSEDGFVQVDTPPEDNNQEVDPKGYQSDSEGSSPPTPVIRAVNVM